MIERVSFTRLLYSPTVTLVVGRHSKPIVYFVMEAPKLAEWLIDSKNIFVYGATLEFVHDRRHIEIQNGRNLFTQCLHI